MTDLARLDGLAQAELVKNGDVKPAELVDERFQRCDLLEDRPGAFLDHGIFVLGAGRPQLHREAEQSAQDPRPAVRKA